jgi:hypothetical protein
MLRVVHKNQQAIDRSKESAFRQWALDLLSEHRQQNRKRVEKEYGVDLSHVQYPESTLKRKIP